MTNMTKDREGKLLFMYKVYTTTPLEKYKYDMVPVFIIFHLVSGTALMLWSKL